MKIIRQRDFKDCGVCSLASIIEYYNGYVSLEKIRLDVKASNEGTSALNIIEASKKYGFDSIGIKVNSLEDSKIRLPAIAHINLKNGMQHYVVIYKITKNKVILMDPAKGKVVKTKQEFYQEWSKVLLIFYPKSKIITFKKENNLFNIFLDILFKEKKLFVTIIIMSIFMMIFTIISSYYFQIMINSITSNYYILYIKIFVIIFGMITISKLIFTYLRNNLENHLNKNIDCLLNASFIKHIFNLPLEVISSRTSGEIITRVNEVAEKLEISDILNKYPYQISGGQKQRVAAARAIITNPKMILADEPTGSLDSKSARQLLETFEKLNQNLGATILMVTHDAFTASYADRIIFIKDGKIFNELNKGNDTRKQFFEKIIEVQTLLGGDLNNVI